MHQVVAETAVAHYIFGAAVAHYIFGAAIWRARHYGFLRCTMAVVTAELHSRAGTLSSRRCRCVCDHHLSIRAAGPETAPAPAGPPVAIAAGAAAAAPVAVPPATVRAALPAVLATVIAAALAPTVAPLVVIMTQ